MRITTEDGDLWFNKACKSGRIATVIKDNNNSVLYMYIDVGWGGGVNVLQRRHYEDIAVSTTAYEQGGGAGGAKPPRGCLFDF